MSFRVLIHSRICIILNHSVNCLTWVSLEEHTSLVDLKLSHCIHSGKQMGCFFSTIHRQKTFFVKPWFPSLFPWRNGSLAIYDVKQYPRISSVTLILQSKCDKLTKPQLSLILWGTEGGNGDVLSTGPSLEPWSSTNNENLPAPFGFLHGISTPYNLWGLTGAQIRKGWVATTLVDPWAISFMLTFSLPQVSILVSDPDPQTHLVLFHCLLAGSVNQPSCLTDIAKVGRKKQTDF